MSEQTKAVLKAFFETGDKPTEAQFADFIDSYPNIADLGNPIFATHSGSTAVTTVGNTLQDLSDLVVIPANTLSVDGQALEIEAIGSFDASTAIRNLYVVKDIVNHIVSLVTLPAGAKSWIMKIRIIRINATTALVFASVECSIVGGSTTSSTLASNFDTSLSITFASDFNLQLRGQSPSGGNITFNNWRIKKFGV